MSARAMIAARRVQRDRGGVALIEFALILPILLTLALTGIELTNYITVKMRVSQLALMLADNAARMGTGTPLAAKVITETDINDLFAGGNLQSGALDLRSNGRVILSDLEQDPLSAGRYKIMWQRCYGAKTAHRSTYGTAPAGNLTGIGPADRQVTAQPGNATMFVEVYYVYKPLIVGRLAPTTEFVEIASMAVRERRDLTIIYNTTGALISGC
jgi:hypothetical protein